MDANGLGESNYKCQMRHLGVTMMSIVSTYFDISGFTGQGCVNKAQRCNGEEDCPGVDAINIFGRIYRDITNMTCA